MYNDIFYTLEDKNMLLWYIVPLLVSLVCVMMYVHTVWKNSDIHNKDLFFILFWILLCFVPFCNFAGVIGLFVYGMITGIDWAYKNKAAQLWLNKTAIHKKK